jgi:RimJ/RimL family protein N-acetyltransferase
MLYCSYFDDIYLDADIDFEMAMHARNQEPIRRFNRQFTLISAEEQMMWAERILDPDIKMFSIRVGEDQVGVCGFTSIDRHNQSAEFSCYIDPEYQRNSYGKKALFLLFRHGFHDWNFQRIWGETLQGNFAFGLFTNVIGMNHAGTWKKSYFKRGRFIDSYLIELQREDFKEKYTEWKAENG